MALRTSGHIHTAVIRKVGVSDQGGVWVRERRELSMPQCRQVSNYTWLPVVRDRKSSCQRAFLEKVNQRV